ncbi:DEAD/DEAH box helicase family protein [Reichenbachiella ulvae]|uniref:DEAD/DEAH box helicase family protein n=1 Tax=Reichenbachiella ulvae TaxID=2980104 RepID=A0ABT3CWY5_9BACT|nr:DEAD/DEAH box helicase family protein [Reichenbachiella ulvae]MCV9388081.1 DEAD/DEAH box helicase family protein [Reichenbachiella ulvae]
MTGLIKPAKELEVVEYVSEKYQEVEKVVFDNASTLLVSEPSSGKTTLAKELMMKNKSIGGRSVFCCGLMGIPNQMQNASWKWDLVCNSEDEKYKKRLKSGEILKEEDFFVAATFQQFVKLQKYLNEEDLIIIDEAHLLISWIDLVKEMAAVRSILTEKKFRILYLTGTPYLFDISLLDIESWIQIKVKDTFRTNLDHYFVKHAKHLDPILFITETLLDWSRKLDCFVIFNNNKKQNRGIQEFLSWYNFKSYLYDADHKTEQHYKQLITNGTIPKDAKVLICTSIVSIGLNIYDPRIMAGIVIGNESPIVVKQFAKRSRCVKQTGFHLLYFSLESEFLKQKGKIKDERAVIKDTLMDAKRLPKKLLELKHHPEIDSALENELELPLGLTYKTIEKAYSPGYIHSRFSKYCDFNVQSTYSILNCNPDPGVLTSIQVANAKQEKSLNELLDRINTDFNYFKSTFAHFYKIPSIRQNLLSWNNRELYKHIFLSAEMFLTNPKLEFYGAEIQEFYLTYTQFTDRINLYFHSFCLMWSTDLFAKERKTSNLDKENFYYETTKRLVQDYRSYNRLITYLQVRLLLYSEDSQLGSLTKEIEISINKTGRMIHIPSLVNEFNRLPYLSLYNSLKLDSFENFKILLEAIYGSLGRRRESIKESVKMAFGLKNQSRIKYYQI